MTTTPTTKTGAPKLQSRNQLARTQHNFQPRKPMVPGEPVPPAVPHGTPDAAAWRGVFFDGPEPDRNRDGDEIPVWTVYVGTEDAEPIGRVYRIYSFTKAEALARAMSFDRNLELVIDATPADMKTAAQVAEPVAA